MYNIFVVPSSKCIVNIEVLFLLIKEGMCMRKQSMLLCLNRIQVIFHFVIILIEMLPMSISIPFTYVEHITNNTTILTYTYSYLSPSLIFQHIYFPIITFVFSIASLIYSILIVYCPYFRDRKFFVLHFILCSLIFLGIVLSCVYTSFTFISISLITLTLLLLISTILSFYCK